MYIKENIPINIKRIPKIDSIWSIIKSWLIHYPTTPLICIRTAQGRFFILAIKFKKISYENALNITLQDNSKSKFYLNTDPVCQQLPFYTGIIGLLSYDDFAQNYSSNIHSQFFYVCSSLVFDTYTQTCWLCENIDYNNEEYYKINLNQLLDNYNNETIAYKITDIQLIPHNTKRQHLENIKSAICDIKNGRYYQINLLRYFHIKENLNIEHYLNILANSYAPYSALIKTDNLLLISLSPEKFIEIYPKNNKYIISSYPIKGTTPRFKNPILDKLSSYLLLKDKKNLAELHMIIDLIRNDLYKICLPNTVQVIKPNELHTFKNVHHLIGSVKGTLQNNILLKDIFYAICPGGSITGAPKKEVMKAIYEYEKRPRGYFMGNIFCFDFITHKLDSSILIRTLIKHDTVQPIEFAAGGGIVIKSNPKKELNEINHKALIVGKVIENF